MKQIKKLSKWKKGKINPKILVKKEKAKKKEAKIQHTKNKIIKKNFVRIYKTQHNSYGMNGFYL